MNSDIIPSNLPIRLVDRSHSTYVFIFKRNEDYFLISSAEKTLFDPENFKFATSFALIPVDGGLYQIKDYEHNSTLFIGDSKDDQGNHYVYGASSQ